MTPEKWGVVGGGLLGMTLAMRLRQAGHSVTLVEAAEQLGGLAATWTIGDTVWDKHYHVILRSDHALRGVLDELGLSDDMRWVETRTGVYADGVLYSVSNTREFLRFPLLTSLQRLRLGWTIFYASRITNWERLERVTAAEWLSRHSGQRAYEAFWKPLLRSKLGSGHKMASAAFIWAIIQRLYAARRTGLKKEMFGYVRGGYATILSRFADYLQETGVRTVLGCRVERVGSHGGLPYVDTNRGTLEFDRLVVTAASPIAARLIPDLRLSEADRMKGVTYQGIVCASVLLEHPLADFYVTNITDSWVPFTGVIEMTTLVEPAQFGGKHLVYLPRYTTQDDEANTWTDDEVEERFLGALERMYPSFRRQHVVSFRISRVRYVLPVSTIGYSKNVPSIATSIPGVYTVNSAQIVNGTLNVNETIQLAEKAIADLLSGSGLKAPVDLIPDTT